MFTDRVCPDLLLAEWPGVANGVLDRSYELHARNEHYHENTWALRMLWAHNGKTPWTDLDNEAGKGCKSAD